MHWTQLLHVTRVVVVASLSSATAAHAQSALTGTVLAPETRQPLEGVVVTATSPALQGEQRVVTDAQGQFRIPALPPGVYVLRFDKEAFDPFWRTEIDLPPEQTVQVDAELSARAVEQRKPGPCESPTLDVCSSTTGQYVARDFTQHLAVNRPAEGGAARSFEALAGLVPGTQSEPGGFSIHGASPLENRYVVDGLTTQGEVFDFNVSPLGVEFLQDVQVITGGYMPQYGRGTGGLLQVRTRSGSNELHGSVYSTVMPGFLVGTGTQVRSAQSVVSSVTSLNVMGDVGATLSGSIIKDKLWFFAGVAPSYSSYTLTRSLNPPVPGSERHYPIQGQNLQYLGKVTYLLNQDHNVSMSFSGTPSMSGPRGLFSLDPETGGLPDSGNGTAYYASTEDLSSTTSVALKYAGAFAQKKLLIDANAGWLHQAASTQPLASTQPPAGTWAGDSPVPTGLSRIEPNVLNIQPTCDGGALSTGPGPVLCPITDYFGGAPGFVREGKQDGVQMNAQGTYLLELLGSHVIKAGADVELLSYTQRGAFTGGVTVRESLWQDSRRYGRLTGPDPAVDALTQTRRSTSTTAGGFLQDSWTIANRVTLNAGVRYDTQWLNSFDGPLAFALSGLSPRVGLVVEPMAQGRMKLVAHYAKYHGQLPLSLINRAFPGERRYEGYQPQAHRAPVDPAIVPPSSSELVAGAEYELPWNTRLSAHYTHQGLDSAIVDMSLDDGQTYFLGNPGSGLANLYPKAERTYDGVTVALSRTFRDGWLAQASYTWSRLSGNYVGPISDWTGAPHDFELISQTRNRSGPLPYDRTHSLKLFGAREFRLTGELSASLGLSYLGRSGTPINYLGSHPALGPDETFVLPRGSTGERTPWVHVIDSHVGMNYRLGGDKVVSFSLEVFNLFNFQQVTRVDETYTRLAVLPLEKSVKAGELTPGMIQRISGSPLTEADVNAGFKQPLEYQTPRQVRLGLRYAF